jgi:ribosome-associated heat shock protein Hsp15
MDIKIIASTRIDKFLWAARFYKTRSLATDDIGKGRVKINGLVVKAAREVRAGDCVAMVREGVVCTVDVLQVSEQRGPAPQAHTLYRETERSRCHPAPPAPRTRAEHCARPPHQAPTPRLGRRQTRWRGVRLGRQVERECGRLAVRSTGISDTPLLNLLWAR